MGSTYVPNFYLTPPPGNITIDEAEDLFKQRLDATSILEKLDTDSPQELENLLSNINSNVYKTSCVKLYPNGEQLKQDNISHFLARFYFSVNPNLHDSYRIFERKLLYHRLKSIHCFSTEKLRSFLESFNFSFELMSNEEYIQLAKRRYVGWNKSVSDNSKNIEPIFKVKFEHALNFVSKRSVAVLDGMALLTGKEIISVICDSFEKHIEKSLILAAQSLNMDYRSKHLYDCLDLVYQEHMDSKLEKKRSAKTTINPYSIDIEDIDNIANKHFPPCMRYLHQSLKEDHHLRHQGRLYYLAFLRSGGVELDSAVEFFKGEFTKKIPVDKFDRDYKYNIRHIYGKEGNKKALSSFSCETIINKNAPGPADKHGCVFKHFPESHLTAMLMKHGVKECDISTMLMMKSQNEHTRACSEYFKFTHSELPPEPIRNPMQFYDQSMRFQKSEASKEIVFDEDMPEIPEIKEVEV